MGIFGGAMGYLRFQVHGPVAPNFLERYERTLEIRRFVPLHEEGQDLESYGFVSVERPYADDIPLTNDQFLFGDQIVLGYREDVVSFPKPLLKDMIQTRLEYEASKTGRDPTSELRKAVEGSVKAELRRRILPKSKVVECAWDLQKAQVRFFGRGKTIGERFVKLFQQTFDVRLQLMTYADRATSAALPLDTKAMLEALKPHEIFHAAYRTEIN